MERDTPTLTIAASTGALVPAPMQGRRANTLTDSTIREGLADIRGAGFSAVELSDIWVDMRKATPALVKTVGAHCDDAGLEIVGLSTLGLQHADNVLTATIELGAPTLCIGLHQMPGNVPPNTSFWAVAPEERTPDDAEFQAIAKPLRLICKRAADAGIGVVVEMNEHAIIDRASHVLRLLDITGADNLGVNPDLGNLTRVTVPMRETWYDTLDAVADRTRYWHVKNNLRLEQPTGVVMTHPCALAEGVIDYRTALKTLIEAGFAGPIVVEAYWGDRIAALQDANTYLSDLIKTLTAPANNSETNRGTDT